MAIETTADASQLTPMKLSRCGACARARRLRDGVQHQSDVGEMLALRETVCRLVVGRTRSRAWKVSRMKERADRWASRRP